MSDEPSPEALTIEAGLGYEVWSSPDVRVVKKGQIALALDAFAAQAVATANGRPGVASK